VTADPIRSPAQLRAAEYCSSVFLQQHTHSGRGCPADPFWDGHRYGAEAALQKAQPLIAAALAYAEKRRRGGGRSLYREYQTLQKEAVAYRQEGDQDGT
jgi:hypothetical protein